ncbi:hypothetical protein GW17_00008491 [Ensete ventricosum]|nr:hypothetical protein GW17_00008491 [Ensete ventricosum]
MEDRDYKDDEEENTDKDAENSEIGRGFTPIATWRHILHAAIIDDSEEIHGTGGREVRWRLTRVTTRQRRRATGPRRGRRRATLSGTQEACSRPCLRVSSALLRSLFSEALNAIKRQGQGRSFVDDTGPYSDSLTWPTGARSRACAAEIDFIIRASRTQLSIACLLGNDALSNPLDL